MTKIPINKPKKEKKEDNKSYYFRWDLTRYSTKKFSPPGEKKAGQQQPQLDDSTTSKSLRSKRQWKTCTAHNMLSVLAGNLLKKLRGTDGSLCRNLGCLKT